MAKAKFDDFKPQTYQFEVEAPDGSMFEFEMRALTPAELLDIDIGHPRPQPRVVDFKPATKKGGEPTPIYSSDETAPQAARDEWMRLINNWLREHRNRQIIAALVMDIPGDTVDEQIAQMETLGAWAISAFSKAVQMVLTTSEGALSQRHFR